MRHATPAELDRIEPLLVQLRRFPAMVEKKRGLFYVKSRAFLHFHEDPTGLYVDVRLSGVNFERFRVETAAERKALVTRLRVYFSDAHPKPRANAP